MGFEKREVIDQMTNEEQLKGKIAFYRIFIGALQIFEFGTAFWYVANLMQSKEITSTAGQVGWFLQYVFLVLLIVLLIDLQSISFYGFSSIFDKKNNLAKFIPIGWGILYVGLSVVIIYGDTEGSKYGAKKHFGYTPQKIDNYQSDSKFKSKEEYRKKLEAEKESSLDKFEQDLKNCIVCKAIYGQYDVKIAAKKRSLRHSKNMQDQSWIKKVNKPVQDDIDNLIRERDAAITDAKAKIEARRDSIDAIYVAKINATDTTLASLTNKINEHNEGEDAKKEGREKQIDDFSFGIAPLTQLLMVILRFLLLSGMVASGYTWHSAGSALKAMSIISSIQQYIEIYTYEWAEKGKINRTSKLAQVIENVEQHLDSIGGDAAHAEKVRLLLENNAQSTAAAKALLVKSKNKKTGSVKSDKELILELIQDYTDLLDFVSDVDKPVIQSLIDDYNLLLGTI